MAEHSKIEWTDSTFNPWFGCQKVGPGCDHCYAETLMDTRLRKVQWGPGQERKRTSASNWRQPLLWEREREAFALMHGRRRRVFCASLADVFDNEVPPAWRAELFALIAGTPHLDWLLLTKRIGNVAAMIEAPGMQKCGLPENVWLGATVVNQEEADRDIPKLLAVPARVRFLSIEPMLGPINLRRLSVGGGWHDALGGWRDVRDLFPGIDAKIDWVIAGGESGPHARPAHPEWPRSLRDQCAASGVPFLMKQWGEWAPPEAIADDGTRKLVDCWIRRDGRHDGGFFDADTAVVYRAGKKAAGRLLDGVKHDGMPGATT